MITRIEIYSKISDTRAFVRKKKTENAGYKGKLKNLWLSDVYTIEKTLTSGQLKKIASSLSNPVTQKAIIIKESSSSLPFIPGKFEWAIEIGYLPGVTDNSANTAKEIIEDLLKTKFTNEEGVYTSEITFIKGDLSLNDAGNIASLLHNPLIQRSYLKNYRDYIKDKGMDFAVPKVRIKGKGEVLEVNLDVSSEELQKIGKEGIASPDGTRRGPLALDLLFMIAIRDYFKKMKRNPTDIELESLAQTWSEHCKHTIFADPLDGIKDGLFKTYIKKTTESIRKKKGRDDHCVSVFSDNSGAVSFDKDYLITHKVETHNTPSALDPYGGSITGIVGVNRDTIGFGLGAKPIANFYGFCLADPRIDRSLYKGPYFTQKMLSARRIMDGVIEGVNAGGNQSGIPTPMGFLYFDERFRGKPLVFVGTLGIIPKKIKNKLSHEKKAQPKDYIVMAGGRVGKDGIHGATFSSEGLSSGSPVTAVQIGDPITQKKLSDAIVKEARMMLLYNSITDNGAGGLSCSVAEMAKESNGCIVHLDKVPLKYAGLDPWEIWVSESQERMTLAVPPRNLKRFISLMKRRGVEATAIGKFTDSGRCTVKYKGKTIMDIDLQFLHFGLPKRPMKTRKTKKKHKEPAIAVKKELTGEFVEMIGRLNNASYEFITTQYDHTVQSNLALSPLGGKGRINSSVSVIKPLLSSNKGIILSYGIYPSYSDIDAYQMAASCIDTAVRNIVAAGGSLDEIYLLDNFCWCEGNDPFRLWQLKKAAQACHVYAKAYGTPFISGKDSMFNDFKGYDKKGNPIKISIPPTLLITSMGIIEDIYKVVSSDLKVPGDLVYLLGETNDELGSSEYFSLISDRLKEKYVGNQIPSVDARKNLKLYRSFQKASSLKLISSSISLARGGLAAALIKSAMGGKFGLKITLNKLVGKVTRDDFALFSESQGRILTSINLKNQEQFEKIMAGRSFKKIGRVTQDDLISIEGLNGKLIVKIKTDECLKAYRATFKDY